MATDATTAVTGSVQTMPVPTPVQYRHRHHNAGFALLSIAVALITIIVIAVRVWRRRHRPDGLFVALTMYRSGPSPERSRLARRGYGRLAVLFGTIVLQLTLLPRLGIVAGTVVAIAVGCGTFLALHRRFGL